MRIDSPSAGQILELRQLWKEAFGDSDAYLDIFFQTAFSQDRCRCLCIDGQLAAALYWFDCCWEDKPLAYLYAVATRETFRKQGLASRLINDTHQHLQSRGYVGSLLVPASTELFSLYEKLGYRTCSEIREFTCAAGHSSVPTECISSEEYALLRRQMLPPGGVIQEGAALAFLQTQANFYTGGDFILCAAPEENKLVVHEYFGNPAYAPGILTALGASEGRFRVPGKGRPFAMYCPLAGSAEHAPKYFGLALDC